MRKLEGGFDPWEVEAARRREVVASDFGAGLGSRRELRDRADAGTELRDRADGTRSAIAATDARHSSARGEPVSRCRPGVAAIEPGA